MISLNFVKRLSSTLKIEGMHMVERDVILHQILADLSKNKFFSKNFLFKGGTCLIKHHLNYFRFSEDVDFTWRDQSRFRDKTTKQTRRELSTIIDTVGRILEQISSAKKLDFKCSKNDTNYVEFGGNNKMCTFKMWYYSVVLERRSFIKVQINFVEEICARPKKGQLKSLATDNDEKMRALFTEYSEYSETIIFDLYDIREILSEKVRALITRKGVKARDFLDVFFIQKETGIRPIDVEKWTIKKTEYVLNTYVKYRDNLKAKKKVLEKGDMFKWGTEKELLLTEIDEIEFQIFVKELTRYIKELINKFILS